MYKSILQKYTPGGLHQSLKTNYVCILYSCQVDRIL